MGESKTRAHAASSGLPEEAAVFVNDWLGGGWSAEPLRGDASVRAYYRLTAGAATYMLAYYPDQLREQAARFLRAQAAVADHLRVPGVIRSCGFAVVQEDVGDFTLYDLLHRDREMGLRRYREAVEVLLPFQQSPPEARALNPPFDAVKFEEELEMALEYYVVRLAGERDREPSLRKSFSELAQALARHPYLLTHRDYHGQNIHLFNDDLIVIDYQDLRMGPDTYDLASLLRDRGVARIIGEEQERALVTRYAELLGAGPQLHHRYHETLLQRSIKILGTFAKQALDRGREHYLAFIPPTLESVRFCLGHLPEYDELRHTFPLETVRSERYDA